MYSSSSRKKFAPSDCETVASFDQKLQENTNPVEYWESFVDIKSQKIERKKQKQINRLLNKCQLEKHRQQALINEYIQFHEVIFFLYKICRN